MLSGFVMSLIWMVFAAPPTLLEYGVYGLCLVMLCGIGWLVKALFPLVRDLIRAKIEQTQQLTGKYSDMSGSLEGLARNYESLSLLEKYLDVLAASVRSLSQQIEELRKRNGCPKVKRGTKLVVIEDDNVDYRRFERACAALLSDWKVERAATLSEGIPKAADASAVVIDMRLPDAQVPLSRFAAGLIDRPMLVWTGVPLDQAEPIARSLGAQVVSKHDTSDESLRAAVKKLLERASAEN